MDNRMSCMQCGWLGDGSELESAMGWDEMCPYCGSFSEGISYYIPSFYIRMIKRVLFLIISRNTGLYWRYIGAVKRIGT